MADGTESYSVTSYRVYVERLERKAGKAKDSPAEVHRELRMAETAFTSGTVGMSLEDRRDAALRIAGLSEQLIAAGFLIRARRVLAEREAKARVPEMAARRGEEALRAA